MSASTTALRALLSEFNPAQAPDLIAQIDTCLSSRAEFLEKVKEIDKLFAANRDFEPVEEYAFDLLMSHHLEENQDDERYFDSREWQDIEDKTLERGTELLNILLYLIEARDNDVEVSLDDFLNEFLLIEEDEFQDEYAIYEDLITNMELLEEEPGLIAETAHRMDLKPELKELFLPLLLFFKQPNGKPAQVAGLSPVEHSLYHTLLAYHQAR